MNIDDWVFGVAAVDAAGHESTVSAYVAPPRATDGGADRRASRLHYAVFGDLPVDDDRRPAAMILSASTKCSSAACDVLGVLDELDAGPVEDDAFLQLADVAVGDPPLDHDRAVAERNPEVVQRVELQRERRLDLRARRG